jgi:hypothetical protein
MAKTTFVPSPAQTKELFRNSIWYEIVYTFGVPEHDPRDYCQWEMINYSRLAHARVLYDFLQTPKADRHLDDVVVEDFRYPVQAVTLPPADRDRLNKDLLHLSYGRVRHTRKTKPWPSSILSNLLDPVLGFMRHIRDSRQDLFDGQEEAIWSDLIEKLRAGANYALRHGMKKRTLCSTEFG